MVVLTTGHQFRCMLWVQGGGGRYMWIKILCIERIICEEYL